MNQSRHAAWVGILLMVAAAAVFAGGIGWGLPGKAIDPLLFGDAVADSKIAAQLSGAQIAHQAGQWEDNPNRPADAAMHPLAGRDEPITLLANPPVMTPEQVGQLDPQVKALLDREEKDFQILQKLNDDRSSASPGQISRLETDIKKVRTRINDAAKAFNSKKLPELSDELLARDARQRAQIIRRFRLYSAQPDEMITFRALASMHPGQHDFDPRLYQYGGLWIYPVGALIKASAEVGFITLYRDQADFLDHPEEFAKFYIIARAYSAAWGVVAVAAVFMLLKRLTRGNVVPAIGALAFIAMPGIISMAHEAKPHLATLSLMLLAIIAAAKYIEHAKFKWAFLACILCGAAAGMSLAGLIAAAIIPIMALLSRDTPARRTVAFLVGVSLMLIVYFAANPYVALHLLHPEQHSVLWNNLNNTRAMYPAGSFIEGAERSLLLLAAAASLPIAILGAVSAILLACTRRCCKTKSADPTQMPVAAGPALASEPDQRIIAATGANGIGWMLTMMSVIVLLQMARVGANKPGEFARFALLPATALLIATFAMVGRAEQCRVSAIVIAAIILLAVCLYGASYEKAFIKDASPDNSRVAEARRLNGLLPKDVGRRSIGVYAEPAPYCLPPINLFRWRLVLLPPGGTKALDGTTIPLILCPDDRISLSPFATPITWANVSFVERIATQAVSQDIQE